MPAPEFNLLEQALPIAIPLAVAWAQEQEAIILRTGVPLTPALVVIARNVGVQRPESVRVRLVPKIPEQDS